MLQSGTLGAPGRLGPSDPTFPVLTVLGLTRTRTHTHVPAQRSGGVLTAVTQGSTPLDLSGDIDGCIVQTRCYCEDTIGYIGDPYQDISTASLLTLHRTLCFLNQTKINYS